MDLEEVKTCIRALLSSSAFSYKLNNLLSDFKSTTGRDLPLFGSLHPVEFLRTLDDTVQLLGNPFDPEIALIESKKSAHITSLVDRQRNNTFKNKYPQHTTRHRLILPNKNQVVSDSKQNKSRSSRSTSYENKKEAKPFQPSLKQENTLCQPRETKPLFMDITNSNPVKNDTKLPKVESPNHEKEVLMDESKEVEKSDSCFFDDVSDNDSCFSVEGSRSSSGHPRSSPCSLINDGIRKKLKDLIKNYPQGLWCCELPELFLKEYQFVLDYREFGYTSLIQMLSELPDVFRCIRPGDEDWILFDASVPPSSEEKRLVVLQSTTDANREIRTNLKKLLLSYLKNSSDSGIELSLIPSLYEKKFGRPLDVKSLGFKDVKSLLETWEESSLQMIRINGSIYVVPAFKIRNSSPSGTEAVPPVTAENDIFIDIFPKDVVGPDEPLVELDLCRHVAVGHVIEVCVAEVWSPGKFYLQLNKFKNRLNRFMDDLQRFYSVHLNKYKMPNSTIRPNQVCVGLYSSEPEFPDEWHRAKIVKVINDKTVLINFVDFGTVTRVKKTQLRFLHRSFQYFPVQAFLAELSGVAPPNDQDVWPMSTNRKFLEYLRLPYLKAEVTEIDFREPAMSVILVDPFQTPTTNLNKRLIEEKLAWEKEPVNDFSFLFPESEEEGPKPTEPEKKTSTDNSTAVQENCTKNLPNEFSDITDLDHESTLFHFQMKCLKLDNSQEKKEKENLKKPEKDLNMTFEFEDVPELDKSTDEEKVEHSKEKAQNDFSKSKKSFTKFIPPRLENKQSFNPPPSPPQGGSTPPKPSFPPPKPKTYPPGLEPVAVFPPFHQSLFLVNPENVKKRINILAMELLTKNPSIQQVGMNDPVLALKIATEMAEAYVGSELAAPVPHGFTPLLTPPLLVPGLQTNACEPKPTDFVETETTNPVIEYPDIMTKQDKPQPPSDKSKSKIQVKKKKIDEKDVHFVFLDNKYYYLADEIVKLFTLFSNREIADRLLRIKKITINYRVLSKKTDEEVIKEIKSVGLPVSKNQKKLNVYLIPVEKVVEFLQGLGCQIESFKNEFLNLEETKKEESDISKSDK